MNTCNMLCALAARAAFSHTPPYALQKAAPDDEFQKSVTTFRFSCIKWKTIH